MIFTRRVVAVLCLILFGSLVFLCDARGSSPRRAANQDKEEKEWRRYTVSGEEFSVMLPVVPAMNTDSAHVNRTTSRRERILGAYSDGVAYIVYAAEKKGLTLDELAQRITRKDPGPLEQMTVNGIRGKSFNFEDDTRVTTIYFFATNKNLYAFQGVGSKLGNPIGGITKFLSSIAFAKNPEGVKVVDGPGEQPTVDPGADLFTSKQVDRKAIVVTKPEPHYTDAARRAQVTGTVLLRVVFSSSGAVENITVTGDLPHGLTERASEAARQIRFIPAIKDGRFVSVRMQLEYNFNLY